MKEVASELLMFDTSAAPPTFESARAEIDAMTYEDMLRRVRTARLTDPLFRGVTGRHFHAAMREKRHALSADERAAIHNKVGF